MYPLNRFFGQKQLIGFGGYPLPPLKKIAKKIHKMVQKALRIEFLDQKYLFLEIFFLSEIDGFSPPPLNGSFLSFFLAEFGGKKTPLSSI